MGCSVCAGLLFDDFEGLPVGEDGDEDEEDDAFDELEGLRREADHREAGVEDVEEERADDDVAEAYFGAAGDRHAAEHEGDEDLRLELVADVGRGGAVLDDVEEGGEACERAREDVDEEFHAVGADAGEHGAALAGADGLEIGAERRVAEDEEADEDDEDGAGELELDAVIVVDVHARADRRVRGEVFDEPAEEEHRADRDDEGGDLAADVEVGVDRADDGAGCDAAEDGEADAVRGEEADHDGGDAEDRPLGEVEAAHRHDEEDAHCGDHHDVDLVQQQDEVPRGDHGAVGQKDEQDEDGDEADDGEIRPDLVHAPCFGAFLVDGKFCFIRTHHAPSLYHLGNQHVLAELLAAGELAVYGAILHDEDAVAHADELHEFLGDHDDGFVLLAHAVHELVDVLLDLDVDAARRRVEDEDVGVLADPACEHDFLLVAAGEVGDELVDVLHLDGHLLGVFFREGAELLVAEEL